MKTIKPLVASIAAAVAIAVISHVSAHASNEFAYNQAAIKIGYKTADEGFNDMTNSHWAYSNIIWAQALEVIDGYADGSFRPDGQVTEAEFLAMEMKAFYNGSIEDVQGAASWSDKYYKKADELNWPITGKRDTAINRYTVAELISSTMGVHYNKDQAVQYLLGNGYSNGKTAATIEGYQGNDSLTRAEAVTFIKNVRDKAEVVALLARPQEQSNPSSLPPLPHVEAKPSTDTATELDVLQQKVTAVVGADGYQVTKAKNGDLSVTVKDAKGNNITSYTDSRNSIYPDGRKGSESMTIWNPTNTEAGGLDMDKINQVVHVLQAVGVSTDQQFMDAIVTVWTTYKASNRYVTEKTIQYADTSIWVSRSNSVISIQVHR